MIIYTLKATMTRCMSNALVQTWPSYSETNARMTDGKGNMFASTDGARVFEQLLSRTFIVLEDGAMRSIIAKGRRISRSCSNIL